VPIPGRNKFLKFEGTITDGTILSPERAQHPPEQLGSVENPARIPDSDGIPPSTFDDVVLAPWNDVATLEDVLKRHGHETGRVITEPIMANMGCILPREGYLQRLRELTRDCGALLILDEVVTGFRYSRGGCQEYYGVQPDISTFGKALGAGFPVEPWRDRVPSWSACAGAKNMVLHYGTFNGHRLTMKVVAANLDLLSAEDALSQAARGGQRRDCRPSGKYLRRRKAKAIVQGFGSIVPDLLHGTRCHPRLPATIASM